VIHDQPPRFPQQELKPMIYPFTYKHWIFVDDKQLVIAESELRATLEPDPDDADDWTIASIEVLDVANDLWVTLPDDNPWRAVFVQSLQLWERTAIDSEWIAHRNAEGDAALYGVEG
jgi:hypothetical protein